jgi:hypothetical protein
MTLWLRLFVCLAACLAWPSGAFAVCNITSFQTTSPSVVNVGTYTVSSTPTTYTVNITVQMGISTTGGTCKGSIALQRTASPALMAISPAGTSTLPYDVRSVGSGVSQINYGSTITKFIALPGFAPLAGTTTATATVSLSFVPGSPAVLPLAGFYLDQTLTVRGYDTAAGTSFRGSLPLVVTANVASGCALTSPSAITLDFTSDIFAARPRGVPQTATFGVNCNATSRLYLTSSAMAPTAPLGPLPGFDTMINFNAQVTMSGAAAALTTTFINPSNAISTARTTTGSNVPVNVKVTLVPGNPLRPATYKSVLRIFIDPAL